MPDSEWPVAFPCESVPLGLACWAMRIERQVPQRGASRVTLTRCWYRSAKQQSRAVSLQIQSDSSCWRGGTDWQGRNAMRIRVSS